MKAKVRIDVFSEDDASIYEARCVVTNAKLDSHYIGATDWQDNRKGSLESKAKFYKEMNEKYEVVSE